MLVLDVTIFQFVISQSNLIVDYKFDVTSERWCEAVFQLPLGNKSKLDLATIVEKSGFSHRFVLLCLLMEGKYKWFQGSGEVHCSPNTWH